MFYLQPVGCDLEIGSLKTVDSCGVCGGDGKTCALPLYQWNENTNTTCSVKCGGGKLKLSDTEEITDMCGKYQLSRQGHQRPETGS